MRLLAELKRVDGLAEAAEITALEAKAQAARQAAKDAMPLSKQAGILEKKLSWKEGTKSNAAERVATAKAAIEEANAVLQKANSEFEARSKELESLQAELAALRKKEQECPPPTSANAPSNALDVLTAALASVSASPEVMAAMASVRRTVETASMPTINGDAGHSHEEEAIDEMQIDEILAEDDVVEAFGLAVASGDYVAAGANAATAVGGRAERDGDAGAAARGNEVQAKRRKAITLVAQKIAKSRRQCG